MCKEYRTRRKANVQSFFLTTTEMKPDLAYCVMAALVLTAAPLSLAASAKEEPAPARSRKKASPPEPGPAKPKQAAAPPLSGALLLGAGFPFSSGPAWFRGQLRLAVPITEIEPRLRFEVVPLLGYGWTTSQGAFSSTSTAHGFEVVPLARLRFLATERLHVYGDFGVGAIHYRFTLDMAPLGRASGMSTGAAFRLHAGLEYAVSDRLAITVEPVNLLFQTATEGTFRFGSTTFTSSTGIGPQASFLAGARLLL